MGFSRVGGCGRFKVWEMNGPTSDSGPESSSFIPRLIDSFSFWEAIDPACEVLAGE